MGGSRVGFESGFGEGGDEMLNGRRVKGNGFGIVGLGVKRVVRVLPSSRASASAFGVSVLRLSLIRGEERKKEE